VNLLHLKALCEIVDQGLHLSHAAQTLHRSQPALTRQIQSLESELGTLLFERNRNRLIGLTEQGKAVVAIAHRIIRDAGDIERVVQEGTNAGHGELRVATTHTQARYTLLPTIREFMDRYPGVTLSLRQGTPVQCCDMVAMGLADIAICTETSSRDDILQLPCYLVQRLLVTPPRHPLLQIQPLTLEAIARYPLITHLEGVDGRSVVERAFREAKLTPKVVLAALDADLSKAYVEMGMGVAIIVKLAFDPKRDKTLRHIDASHLLEASHLNVVTRPNAYLRGFTLDFIRMFAPHIPTAEIQEAVTSPGAKLGGQELPVL
jgi:LysR family cys regulon transcriptional activator